MIKFFRHIRKSLLMENKTSRYFKYAIGEIILVVIGILIALQINNWNEEKKQFTYESKILTEIYRGLQTDSARIVSWIKPRVHKSLQASNQLMEDIHNKKYPGDSVFQARFKNLKSSGYLTINFGPYETLKSNGLDKIKNESLRFKLVDIFESVFPRQLNFIESRDELQKNFREEMWRKFKKLNTYISSTKKITLGYKVEKKTFYDYRFLQLISAERSVSSTMDYRSEVILESMSVVLNDLRSYFDQNNIDYEKKFKINALGVRSQLSDSTYVRSK